MAPRAPKSCTECRTLFRGKGSKCTDCNPQRFSRTNPGSRKRTTTPGHRKRRLETLAAAGNRCTAPYPDICTGNATVYDHRIAVNLWDCLPASVRAKVSKEMLDTAEWNRAALCEKCSRRKSSREGHWLAGHDVERPYDLTVIPAYVLDDSLPKPAPRIPRSIVYRPKHDDDNPFGAPW